MDRNRFKKIVICCLVGVFSITFANCSSGVRDETAIPKTQIVCAYGTSIKELPCLPATDASGQAIMIADPLAADIPNPRGLAWAPNGDIYIASESSHRVLLWRRSENQILRVAGTGVPGDNGDKGLAVNAQLAAPTALAIDPNGNLYIADTGNDKIRMVTLDGYIKTFAGTEKGELNSPGGLSTDTSGNLYIADTRNHRILKIDIAGKITTVAGTGEKGLSGDGEAAKKAQIAFPTDVKWDKKKGLYIVDQGNRRIRHVDDQGIITTHVGADSSLRYPTQMTLHKDGHVIFAETASHSIRIKMLDGSVETILKGNTQKENETQALSVNVIPINYPTSVLTNSTNELFLTDTTNHRILKLDSEGILEKVAGNGQPPAEKSATELTKMPLGAPAGLAVTPNNEILLADSQYHKIWKLNEAAATVESIAGTGSFGFTDTSFNYPSALLRLPDESVIIADSWNHRIRKISKSGSIETLAGTGDRKDLFSPMGLAVTPENIIFISDTWNHRLLKLEANQTLTTLAGTGQQGFAGDIKIEEGKENTTSLEKAQFSYPMGLALDQAGHLYIADSWNHRIRKIDLTKGTITTIAGKNEPGDKGLNGPAIQAHLNKPVDLAFSPTGELYIADKENNRIVMIDNKGKLTKLDIQNTLGKEAEFKPQYITFDNQGQLLISDAKLRRLYRVEKDSSGKYHLKTIAGVQYLP